MGKDCLEELLDAADKDRMFDFIANEYYRLTKEELKAIALEAMWCEKQKNEIGLDRAIDGMIAAFKDEFLEEE